MGANLRFEPGMSGLGASTVPSRFGPIKAYEARHVVLQRTSTAECIVHFRKVRVGALLRDQ